MNKSFWRHFLPKGWKPKAKPIPELAVYKTPKRHMTQPDRWKPPFSVKEAPPLNVDKQNLIVVDESKKVDLGEIKVTIGIMLQSRMDYTFELFINDCLERFKNRDWGGVNDRERWVNDQRLIAQSGTVCGIYTELHSGIQIWIATNLDQGITRICLSDER